MTHFHLGLIGYPLGHSLSPQIHAAALKACGLDGEYSLFPIAPDDTQELINLLSLVRSGEITGLNVTIPHKQNVIPLLDELTPIAKAIGAVNVIYLRGDKLIGDNTDASGFLSDLNKFLTESPSPSLGEGLGVRGKSTLVLGAGGSARSVVYALCNDGWNVTIAARRLDQAQHLAQTFTKYQLSRSIPMGPITTFHNLQLATQDLIVNTTPIGMTPNIDQSPLPENISLPKDTRIYDLVYNPHDTKLVKDARAKGLHATTGLGMLIEQAALGFELWTGHNPPREVMRASVE